MKKTLIVLTLVLLIIPNVTLAAWWNPFTWFNNWQFESKTDDVKIINESKKIEKNNPPIKNKDTKTTTEPIVKSSPPTNKPPSITVKSPNGGENSKPDPERNQPKITLSAKPNKITSDGKFGSSVLTWSSTDADKCYLGKEKVPTSGSKKIVVGKTEDYRISCTGPGGKGLSNSVKIRFITSEPRPPRITASINPTEITSDGKSGTAVLSWSSTDTDRCILGKEEIPTSGTRKIVFDPEGGSVTSSYLITCNGPDGEIDSDLLEVRFIVNY